MSTTLAFIGAGNMSLSLIGGLIASGYQASQLIATDRDPERGRHLSQLYGIECLTDNAQAVERADVVVLAVKPQQLAELCQSLQSAVQAKKPLIVSIAAGVRTRDIDRWLGGETAIVRTMPNTPSLIQSGAAGLYANERVTADQKDNAEHLMRAAGVTVWVEHESELDVITAVSGSGPAYYFLMMEIMQKVGQQMGLSPKTAQLLTVQTAFGAAKMALESHDDCQTLREKVTSPNGTTEKALNVFAQHDLEAIVTEAMEASRDRAKSLADELGRQT
ncbi:pyrroline-5-carboxylate reductase [Thiomicrospira sp. WB1]|uniref:pyrroline-5-carboxylate reductase n=1 Tax=Thiomicrospira sp. WB1 TaxID=1685380 RepID=UPI0007472B66|nr:pyrroline-5-carboxylate reductase [Thiomicrospira sp. WB1]KUJ72802.1 pyrroline-5-carboxylate reductase [Thiomicrospira sp. WB1]